MELTFDDFKNRANNSKFSKWEKIGFPDSYRRDTEHLIFNDIVDKLQLAQQDVRKVLDIGCGCSNLVEYFIEFSKVNNKALFLIDSNEMIANIDPAKIEGNPNVDLLPGYFPDIDVTTNQGFQDFDAIIVYSVLQYPFLEQSIYKFIHKCIDLLTPGGRLLIGDIPNVSARERFLNSKEGSIFKSNKPTITTDMHFDHENAERIDDAIVFSILQRYRNFGCETYLLPQPKNLPFANRREDILIVKR